MKKNKFLQITKNVAFGILLLGGINFLMMGLFNFDFYAILFGGSHSATSRIIYSLFGLATAILLGIIIWNAFFAKKTATKTAGEKATV